MTSAVTPINTSKGARDFSCGEWSETVWLNRLYGVIGSERLSNSPFAAALPAMLVALDWQGTGRSLAANLPPPDVPITLAHLERILSDTGFKTRRAAALGDGSDTIRLRAGSVAQQGDRVAVYLGQPDGEDRWLIGRNQETLKLKGGDTILVVDPDPDFHPVDEARPDWFRGLFERIRDELFAVFAMSSIINLLALAVSIYTMVVYSVVIPSGATQSIWGIALFTTLAVIGGWGLRVGRQLVVSRLGSWAGTRIGEAAMRKMLSFPLDVSAKLGVQNNVIRMRSFENARQFLSGVGGANLIDYPFVVIFLIVIALLGGWLVWVPVVALLLYAALAFPTADYVSSKASAAGTAAARLEERAGAAFLGIDAFYHAGAGSQWLSRFTDLARESASRNRDYAIAVARAQAIGQALSMLTVLATMCVGVLLVLDKRMDAGGLVAAMLLIWRITTPAQQAFGSLVRLRQVKSSVRQLDQLMMTPTERAGVELASPFGLTNVSVTVDRLYLRPDTDQEAALNGVSFSVPAGARAAIVGPNAGGKTTLLECLAGLRRPQSGRVLVNGRDMRQFDATEYRAWVGYVPQVVPALPITVRDYLRLRAPMLQDADALRAFEQVLGADWKTLPPVASWRPLKNDPTGTVLLDRELKPFNDDHTEMRFRYLIAFVAATLGNPPVLLLDGVGLGRNPMWDERVARYLDSIRGRTTVIWTPYTTAHIQSSDQIVIIERGSVRGAGPAAPAAQPPAKIA
jgi:ATP-binding cassette subfamily C protein LapB